MSPSDRYPVRVEREPADRVSRVELPRQPWQPVVAEYAQALAIAVVLALFIRTFFIQAYKIPSGSMEPTLLIGDHLLVNKMAYGLRMPDSLLGFEPLPSVIPYGRYLFRLAPVTRGDVVVFVFPLDPTKDFIKRVIGVGGDTVRVHDGIVYLNGKQMAEPHAHYDVAPGTATGVTPRDDFGPVTVPKGKLLMMGDNRDHSYDSRFWGFVDVNAVEGHALIIYWSWNRNGKSFFPVRWWRIGRVIH